MAAYLSSDFYAEPYSLSCCRGLTPLGWSGGTGPLVIGALVCWSATAHAQADAAAPPSEPTAAEPTFAARPAQPLTSQPPKPDDICRAIEQTRSAEAWGGRGGSLGRHPPG
jgi:hypothetical protein